MSKSKPDHIDIGVRDAGSLHMPNGMVDRVTEQVRSARGLGIGRWIYCKYCYKNVRPGISYPNESLRAALGKSLQVICSECGYGLTPAFEDERQLRMWMDGSAYEEIFPARTS